MFIEPTIQIVSSAPEERDVCLPRRKHFAPTELGIISCSGSYKHCAALRLGQCLTSINTRRRASEYRLNIRHEGKEVRGHLLTCSRIGSLALARQTPLTHGQIAVHNA